MYRARFVYAHALLLAVGAAAIVAFLGWTAFGQQVRVETRTVPQARLSASSSAADAAGRFEGRPETVDGEQLGLPAGTTCDVFALEDGIALVCHA